MTMTTTLYRLVVGLTMSYAATASAQEAPDVRADISSGRAPVSYAGNSVRYNVDDIPELIDLIKAEPDKAWHAALVLGVVGDERAVEPLVELIEKGQMGDAPFVPTEVNEARKAALKALGVVVFRTGSERALEYLIASLDDTIWKSRGVRGPLEGSDQASYDRQLSTYAIFGLAYSGHPVAGEALRSLQQSPRENQIRLRNGLDDIFESWLEVFDLVAERGIAGMEQYYENRRKETGIRPFR